MDFLFNTLLVLHIVGGTVGLLAGAISLLRKKGDKKHQLVGKIFFMAMQTAGCSSLVLACLHSNRFLFMVGVFTLYLITTGQRYLYYHKHREIVVVQWIDRVIAVLMLLTGIVLLGIGIVTLLQPNLFGLVYITFGSLGLSFVWRDFKNYTHRTDEKNYWLVGHLQRMTGGFIAAFTAFLVVNAGYLLGQIPGFVYWLLPTAVLTPLIVKWSRHYEG